MNWEVWVMNLKTSSSEKLFSKAIIKADLKNHWGWPVIAGVLMLFNLFTLLDSSYLMSYFERVDTDVRWTVMAEQLLNYYYFTFFVGIAFAILLGAKLFFYLDKVNSVSCMHGMPFTRKKLFFSHLASGTILILLPAAFITAAARTPSITAFTVSLLVKTAKLNMLNVISGSAVAPVAKS